MSARDIGLATWADRQTPGDPNSPLKNTSKSDARGYVNAVADEAAALTERVDAVEDTAASGYLGRATWTALTGLTPANGTRGSVEPTDVGTHTDPVVGGTVNNAGTYTYVTGTPSGWQRIGEYRGLKVASQATVNAGTNAVEAVTPDTLEDWQSTRWQEIELAFVPGSGTVSSSYAIRVAQPWQKLNPTVSKQGLNWTLPFDCNGNHNVEVQQYDGTVVLGLTFTSDETGAIPAIGSFRGGQRFRGERNPTGWAGPGAAGQLRQTVAPNGALTLLSEEIQTRAQRPSLDKPVFRQRLAERVMSVRALNVAFDTPSMRMPTDEVEWIDYDIARAQSQSAVKCAHFWSVNSHGAEIAGVKHPYGWFLSTEALGGNFERDGHSACESVLRIGLLSSAASTYKELGPGHGGVHNEATDGSLTLYDNVPFSGGVSAPTIGQTMVGQTSGASGVLYRLVLNQAAGMSWGNGNQTGYLCLKTRSKAFIPGEAIRVAGVTKCTATGTGFRTADLNALPIGAPLNCAEEVLEQRFDALFSYTDVEAWAGEIIYRHRTNVDGRHFEIEPRLGRRLKIEAGQNQPAPGAAIEGDTSGVSSILVTAPNWKSTGDWGDGDWVGSLFLEQVSGDFDIGEDLMSGGVKIGEVVEQVGPEIGWVNSYGPLAKLKVGSHVKIPGFNAVPVGRADGQLHPNASDNYGGNSFASWWPVAGLPANKVSPMQCWHDRHAEAGKTVIFDMLFTEPSTVPGDYSLDDDSQVQADDRTEGTIALSVNITSGARRNAEGIRFIRYTHRYRVGDPISVA